jgi:hypothetical protein
MKKKLPADRGRAPCTLFYYRFQQTGNYPPEKGIFWTTVSVLSLLRVTKVFL